MIHVYDQRFDVTGNLENFCELNKARIFGHMNETLNVDKKNKLITQFS